MSSESPTPTGHGTDTTTSASGGPLAPLTGFQRDILWILRQDGPSKGVAIKARLSDYYGTSINHGRLYPNLDTLVDRGLIEKGQRDKRTNEYRLTDTSERGLQHRLQWLTQGGTA